MLEALADGSNFEASETCVGMLLVFCSDTGNAVLCTVECRVLYYLNHDVLLGHDWLHHVNPAINWYACTVSLECSGAAKPLVLAALPVE